MDPTNKRSYLLLLGAVLWVPVTSQAFFRQVGGTFPSLSSSFSLPQAGSQFAPPTAFLQGQSLALNRGKNQGPFVPVTYRPQAVPPQQPKNNDASGGGRGHTYPDGTMGGDYPSKMEAQKSGGGSGQHTYPDGTMGGDYPSKLAEKRGGDSGKTHTYPDGTMSGDYPSHLAAKNGDSRSGQHTYPDGTMGGDYPSHLAAKNGGTKSGQHTYNDGTIGGDYPSHLAAKNGDRRSGQHTYPDGTEGDYPSLMASKRGRQQQQQYPNGQFGGNYPAYLIALQEGTNNVISNSPTPVPHTYPDGTTGGDYPSKMAAQNTQHTYSDGTTGGDYPSKMAAQNTQYTYPDGTAGGDYPSKMAEKSRSAGAYLPSQHVPDNSQFQPEQVSNNFRNVQVYPPSSTQNQLYSPTRDNADTNRRVYPDPRVAVQRAPTRGISQGRQLPRNSFDSFSRGSFPASSSFFRPQGQAGAQQCFRYQDLAASYKLSDDVSDYPMDAIMSELRSNQYLLPMVGYERPPPPRSNSFGGFENSLARSFDSFGFQREENQVQRLTNIKYFPANFDKNTLGQAMEPRDKVCPYQSYTLRTLTVDNNRCTVVNADYQAVTYTKCKRRECNVCGVGQGVNACVEHYNWVSVMVYCPHWQRNQRIQSVRLYLPQGCTCNHYQC